MAERTPIIEVKGLKKSFGSHRVLDGIDFSLYPGESLGVIGGSGTGKSVLIKSILGLVSPDEGEIRIDGQNVNHLKPQERQALLARIGMLFQGGALFDSMPVWQNVAFALLHGRQRINRDDAHRIAFEKLKAVNLDEKVGHAYPAELSGGMQKRAALARAIAAEPDVIFFDEPTTGLDPIVSNTINELIATSVRTLGASAITITHDMNSLRLIADRVGLLHKGKFVWMGPIGDLDTTDNPYVKQFVAGSPHGPIK